MQEKSKGGAMVTEFMEITSLSDMTGLYDGLQQDPRGMNELSGPSKHISLTVGKQHHAGP